MYAHARQRYNTLSAYCTAQGKRLHDPKLVAVRKVWCSADFHVALTGGMLAIFAHLGHSSLKQEMANTQLPRAEATLGQRLRPKTETAATHSFEEQRYVQTAKRVPVSLHTRSITAGNHTRCAHLIACIGGRTALV